MSAFGVTAGERRFIEHRYWNPLRLSFGLAALVLAMPFIVILIESRGWPGQLVGWVGLSLTGVLGLSAMGLRRRFRIDPGARTLELWRAGLFARKRRSTSIDAYRNVELALRSSEGSTALGRVVALVDEDGFRQKLSWFREHDAARAIAEQIARETQKPLVDSLGEEEVELAPDELPATLRERVRRRKATRRAVPCEPPGLRTKVEQLEHQVRLEIPAPDLSRRLLLPLLGVAVLEAALVVAYFGLDRGVELAVVPEALRGFLFGAQLAAAVAAALLLLSAARQGPAVVTADPRRLRVEIHSSLNRRSVEMQSDEVTDLLLSRELAAGARPRQGGGGAAIVACGKRGRAAFGGHLSRDEKRWIRDLLEHALAAPGENSPHT